MNEANAISVIIPLFNKSETIVRAIRSVISQTMQSGEIVIVDDGSTDNSGDVVRALGCEKVRLIVQSNMGVAAARNRGVQEARGSLMAFLDADDEWHKDYLMTILNLVVKYPQCAVFATGYVRMFSDGGTSRPVFRGLCEGEAGIFTNYFEVASRSDPPIWTSAVTVRKEALLSINGFPIGITAGEDLLTWARLAVKFKIAMDNKPQAVYSVCRQDWTTTIDPHESSQLVGVELCKLYREVSAKQAVLRRSLRGYISFWFKLRASVYLRCGIREKSIYSALQSLQWSVTNIQALGVLLVALMPSACSRFFLRRYYGYR